MIINLKKMVNFDSIYLKLNYASVSSSFFFSVNFSPFAHKLSSGGDENITRIENFMWTMHEKRQTLVESSQSSLAIT